MRSTADTRRADVLSGAVSVFARTGFHATPVTSVAAAAGISEAYVFRLFKGKLGLYLAATESCFDRIVAALEAGAGRATTPDKILYEMGGAYAELIADRDLLLFQVQAQGVVDVPEIRQALLAGYARVATLVQERSRCTDAALQQFFAYGQLCHLIVTADLDGVDQPWARALVAGFRHP